MKLILTLLLAGVLTSASAFTDDDLSKALNIYKNERAFNNLMTQNDAGFNQSFGDYCKGEGMDIKLWFDGEVLSWKKTYGNLNTTFQNSGGIGTTLSLDWEAFLYNIIDVKCSLSSNDYKNLAIAFYYDMSKSDYRNRENRRASEEYKHYLRTGKFLKYISRFDMSYEFLIKYIITAHEQIETESYIYNRDAIAQAIARGDVTKLKEELNSPQIQEVRRMLDSKSWSQIKNLDLK